MVDSIKKRKRRQDGGGGGGGCVFFQAEDGIRDTSVTGVQTCALPILTDVTVGMVW